MIDTALTLPERGSAPRSRGLTAVIDPGLGTARFEDLVDSAGEYVDLVKFGWGTVLVTKDIKRKIDVLRSAGIEFYFGGTLFERFALEGLFDDWRQLCHTMGATHVEISNGTIVMSDEEKAGWIERYAGEFTVISEVGAKDHDRSEAMTAAEWVSAVHQDLAAGAALVTTEARESGRSGLCSRDGNPREDVVEQILRSGVDVDQLLFEAPNKDLQTYFVRRFGASVNLGNVAADDVIALETLRLGLRSDTLNIRR